MFVTSIQVRREGYYGAGYGKADPHLRSGQRVTYIGTYLREAAGKTGWIVSTSRWNAADVEDTVAEVDFGSFTRRCSISHLAPVGEVAA